MTSNINTPTVIDLSRVPMPDAIEVPDFDGFFDAYIERFITAWSNARLIDTTLPEYTVQELQTDPVSISGQAFSFLRLYDRQYFNDGMRALLAPYAKGNNLDAIVAYRNIKRIVLQEETDSQPEILEDDTSLLRRFLLKADLPSAASAGRYLYDAFTALPTLQHARVNGFDIHGRRGDTDVILLGDAGNEISEVDLATAKAAIKHENRAPEACSVSVLEAEKSAYQSNLTIFVPSIGPDPDLLVEEAKSRIRAAQYVRTVIGGEIPEGFFSGIAYGDGANILRVVDNAPFSISSDVYAAPVGADPIVSVEVVQ